MIAWVAMPSAAPFAQAGACLDAWRAMGYGVAILSEDPNRSQFPIDIFIHDVTYPGYGTSINRLVAAVLERDPECQVVVAAADDVFPDPDRTADQITAEFISHFGGTMGVMQPVGHSDWSANSLKVAWSPWLGRDWCLLAYGGHGPMWGGYHHFWVDRELQVVAKRLGVFWQRSDITQHHDTWKRKVPRERPQYLMHAGYAWPADNELYESREGAGFPGAELLTRPAPPVTPAPTSRGSWLHRVGRRLSKHLPWLTT